MKLKIKKLLTIIAVNLIILLIFMTGAESYSYKKDLEANPQSFEQFIRDTKDKTYENENAFLKLAQRYPYPQEFNYDKYKEHMRPINYGLSNKKPIIFFGCSFTEGARLQLTQTLAFKISNLTNRTTYNRGKNGTCTQFMYYQLNDKNFKNEVPNANCIIYTFIWDHLARLHSDQLNPFTNVLNLRYKITNNKLEEVKPSFIPFTMLYVVKNIQCGRTETEIAKEQTNYNLFNLMMKESFEIAQKKYPNSKFVILEYPVTFGKKLPQEEILKLENMGFTFIDIEELLGHDLDDAKYRTEDQYHPSELAWNEIAPKLVQKLNL